MSDREPLCQVMEQAEESVPEYMPNLDGARYAAEILALRDRLVPATPEPPLGATGTRDELQDWADWNARNDIWWELTQAAEIAQSA